MKMADSVFMFVPAATDDVGWVKLLPAFSALLSAASLHTVGHYNDRQMFHHNKTQQQ